MSRAEIEALDHDYVLGTYKRLEGVFVRGSGCRMWDSEGNEYLDFLAGIAVCQLGHCHPSVTEAISRQAGTLVHTSNHMLTEPQARLAKKLCDISGMERVFYVVSGTEANETALKIAKKHGLTKRPAGDSEIISLNHSFHGRTLGSLSATAQPKYQDPFRPLVPGFVHIPANDVEALRAAFSEKTAAITIEPIQGEGGVRPVSDEFIKEARALCDRYDALLIIDEVQTGIGRTGQWFAFQKWGFFPDLLCVAKGLGNGVPIGACLTRGKATAILQPGDHGSTFGGGALATATALAVLDTIEREGLLAHAREMSALLRSRLTELAHVKEVRGEGLMLGAILDEPIARDVVRQCLAKRFITNATDEYTLRFVPPLIIQPADIDRAIGVLGEVLGLRKTEPALA